MKNYIYKTIFTIANGFQKYYILSYLIKKVKQETTVFLMAL